MKMLDTFSIESENSVLLKFSDGQSKRVTPEDLPNQLSGRDLERVQEGFSVRKKYFRNLPKWTGAFALSAGVCALAFQVTDVAKIFNPKHDTKTHLNGSATRSESSQTSTPQSEASTAKSANSPSPAPLQQPQKPAPQPQPVVAPPDVPAVPPTPPISTDSDNLIDNVKDTVDKTVRALSL